MDILFYHFRHFVLSIIKEFIWNLFFAKSCDGKLHIRKDLLRYIEEKNDKYLSVLSDYIVSDLYKNPNYTAEEKAEITANISEVENRIKEKNTKRKTFPKR